MDCSICASPFNKGTRTKITCFACDHSACKECIRTFLKMATCLPKCMNCNVHFPTHFLIRNLNRTWVLNTYRETLTKILTGIELGKLPETQPYVEFEIEKQRLRKQNALYELELKQMKERSIKLKNAVHANQYLIRGETMPLHLMNEFVDGRPIMADTRKKFIMACPLDCRGFLSTQYKCGTCQKFICSECLCLKQEGHECVESNRLSAELIKRESKPCPKCGARICKIDGCDQMYCVSQDNGTHCHTAFSWKTGMIETGVIHNPEYYELMRKKGIQLRNAGDVQCGGMPEIRRILRAFDLLKTENDIRTMLVKTHRNVAEIVQYVTHQFRARINAHDAAKRDLRVQYMMKKISRENFSDKIYAMDKDHQKNMDIHHISELISISGIETFQAIVREFPQMAEYEWVEFSKHPSFMRELIGNIVEKLGQLNSVREYCNEQLKEVSITYHCSVASYDTVYGNIPVKYKMNGEQTKIKI